MGEVKRYFVHSRIDREHGYEMPCSVEMVDATDYDQLCKEQDLLNLAMLGVETECDALREKLREAQELLQEAYDYGCIWRGECIYKHVKGAP